MENTFAFPSIHYSQFKRINLPNARPRSHYSKPPVAPRCLLKPKHLSLTLKPRHKPAPTHSLSPPVLLQMQQLFLPRLDSSTWLLLSETQSHTPNPRQNPLLLTGDPAHVWLPWDQASSVQNDFFPLSTARVPRALRLIHCGLHGPSLAGLSAPILP